MDKMGDSGKAGNKGWPATPRDGAPIELTGLLKFFLNWIVTVLSVKAKRYWTWEGVTVKGKLITYKCWNESLLKNFEWMYYVSESDAKAGYRAGIYKDTFGSSIQNADSQLRPNQCIAMVVAPELFDPEHARKCLEIIKDVLASKVGIRTLDPKDADYRGYYENDNDGTDFKVAHGFNYHQGPEWGWVMAYFLRAYHLFNPNKPISLVEQSAHIISNPFKGITELTNDGGAFCPGSCPTQAWSSSCLIELLADLTER